MNFEGPARITAKAEKTPAGLECTVNENGAMYTVRTNSPEGKLTIVRHLDKVPGQINQSTEELIREKLRELTENV